MKTFIDELGNPRFLQGNVSGNGVDFSLAFDIQGPLKPNLVHVIDAAMLYFVAGPTYMPTDDDFDSALTGIWIVPNNTNLPNDPNATTKDALFDVPSRYFKIDGGQDLFSQGGTSDAYFYSVITCYPKPAICPYGYHLRATFVNGSTGPVAMDDSCSLTLIAQVREIEICDC